ncbi:Carbamoyltransferase [Minicystis rosea]|nr:Carbamoyltransferase [Minicystis rosea]
MTGRVVAIHNDTNASAALFLDGELVFAAAEERFSRQRVQPGRPTRTLAAIAERYPAPEGEGEAVIGNQVHFLPQIPLPLLPNDDHDFFTPLFKAYLGYQELIAHVPQARAAAVRLHRALLARSTPNLVHVADHHTAHAYSAYMTSGFDEAVAITSDGFGDGASAKVFRCGAGRCTELYGSSALASPGLFYGEVALVLGLRPSQAGKVTGLAAQGDPSPGYAAMTELFSLAKDGRSFVAPPLSARRRDRGPYAALRAMRPADVAAAAQQRLEDVMLGFVERALDETGATRVALAGGTFANVRLNQRIAALPRVERVFVHPAMSDQGIAVGAGYEHLSRTRGLRPSRMRTAFLGPDYTEDDCVAAVERAGLRYRRERDIDATTAALLADGHVVARFAGRLEYGPRALGHRSILYRGDDASVNDWLNRKLRRTEYMPFAPVTLTEAAEACYGDLSGILDCVRFMTIAVPCTDAMRRESPGVVHVDGTARPQVISEEDEPRYYRLLRLYREKTGKASLINTSFNMHDEPIVCSPDDACRALVDAGLPYLALEHLLVLGPDARWPDP